MRFINRLDERGRFVGLEVDANHVEGDGQVDSHTSSYLHAREQYKKMGDTVGFDLECEELISV